MRNYFCTSLITLYIDITYNPDGECYNGVGIVITLYIDITYSIPNA